MDHLLTYVGHLLTLQHTYIYLFIYIHTYTFAGCRVKSWSQNWGFLSQKLVQDLFGLLFPSFIVFLVFLKSQIVSRGAKTIYLQVVGVSKKGFRKNALFLPFSCWRRRKRKDEENGKGTSQKKSQKCFWWL